MDELSRERIAELRADAKAGHWVRHDPDVILALTDAWLDLAAMPRHYHVASGKMDDDSCRECGLDLRNKIHTREAR